MSFESPTIKFRGFVARAVAAAHARRDPGQDVSGTFDCPRCHSTVRFTTLMDGKSRGTCAQAGCVRWVQ